MAIWFDMTNSLRTWDAGVVGIIRAELEIAKNMKITYPELRVCVCNQGRFEEIPSESLTWLWNAESVADAYMKALGRENSAVAASADNQSNRNAALIGAENYSVSRLVRLLDGAMMIVKSMPKITRPLGYLLWAIAFLPLKVASATRMFFVRLKNRNSLKSYRERELKCKEFSYPFEDGDLIFSAGYFTSDKEVYFTKLKNELHHISLVYLIYDFVLVKKGISQLYNEKQRFTDYYSWVTRNCDYVLYGGHTAQLDAREFCKEKKYRLVPSDYIKFGSDIYASGNELDISAVLQKYNIGSDYIICVGSLDSKKNQQVIYKAYVVLAERGLIEQVPDMVFVGGKYRSTLLADYIEMDPLVRDKMKIVSPDDDELVALYKNCKFAVLPSVYEGWSLTLPEALGYSKFCIVSKVPPLEEIGRDLVDYVDPFDPVNWAETIYKYAKDPQSIKVREKKIKEQWRSISWKECGQSIIDKLLRLADSSDGYLYYDMTLPFEGGRGGSKCSGILRTTLIIARELDKRYSNIRYFALSRDKGYMEFSRSSLADILGNEPIDVAFEKSRALFRGEEGNLPKKKVVTNPNVKTGLWLMFSALPSSVKNRVMARRMDESTGEGRYALSFDVPFTKQDTILDLGTGYEEAVYKVLKEKKKQIGFSYVQLIYDFTPTLLPQTHTKECVNYYTPFLNNTYSISDLVLYGGETAKRDGQEYQRSQGLKEVRGCAVKFGSNIIKNEESIEDEKSFLESLGIHGDFIIAVGSIEARKNHETLYYAYLKMLEMAKEKKIELPQLIFAGYPGWRSEELCQIIARDERVAGKIILCTPSDTVMDLFYRKCLFTVLASQYEGWSLTLPESLNYGKLCIASKVDPLVEIGRDIIDYVERFDVVGWAETMMMYIENKDLLKKKNAQIQKEWKSISWEECADQIATILEKENFVKY